MGKSREKDLVKKIDEITKRINELNMALISIAQHLEEIKNSTSNLRELSSTLVKTYNLVSKISSMSNSIQDQLTTLQKSIAGKFEFIEKEQENMSKRLGEVHREITASINELLHSVKREMNGLKEELKNYIDNTSTRILYMVKELSTLISEKLEKQGGVIDLSREMLLNIITKSIIEEFREKYKDTPLMFTKLGSYPLIIIEKPEEIMSILVTDVPTEQLLSALDKLMSRLSFYTNKKTKKLVITSTNYGSTGIVK